MSYYNNLAQQESNPSYQEMSFQECMGLLVGWEFNKRQHKRLKRLISSAKFQNATACAEDISYRDDRQLDRNFILELTTCNYVPMLKILFLLQKVAPR